MGRPFLELCEDDSAARYTCGSCGADIASSADLICGLLGGCPGGGSAATRGQRPAFLMKATTGNVRAISAVRQKRISSGLYDMCDVGCRNCQAALGWRYLATASAGSAQLFKEECTLLEQAALRECPSRNSLAAARQQIAQLSGHTTSDHPSSTPGLPSPSPPCPTRPAFSQQQALEAVHAVNALMHWGSPPRPPGGRPPRTPFHLADRRPGARTTTSPAWGAGVGGPHEPVLPPAPHARHAASQASPPPGPPRHLPLAWAARSARNGSGGRTAAAAGASGGGGSRYRLEGVGRREAWPEGLGRATEETEAAGAAGGSGGEGRALRDMDTDDPPGRSQHDAGEEGGLLEAGAAWWRGAGRGPRLPLWPARGATDLSASTAFDLLPAAFGPLRRSVLRTRPPGQPSSASPQLQDPPAPLVDGQAAAQLQAGGLDGRWVGGEERGEEEEGLGYAWHDALQGPPSPSDPAFPAAFLALAHAQALLQSRNTAEEHRAAGSTAPQSAWEQAVAAALHREQEPAGHGSAAAAAAAARALRRPRSQSPTQAGAEEGDGGGQQQEAQGSGAGAPRNPLLQRLRNNRRLAQHWEGVAEAWMGGGRPHGPLPPADARGADGDPGGGAGGPHRAGAAAEAGGGVGGGDGRLAGEEGGGGAAAAAGGQGRRGEEGEGDVVMAVTDCEEEEEEDSPVEVDWELRRALEEDDELEEEDSPVEVDWELEEEEEEEEEEVEEEEGDVLGYVQQMFQALEANQQEGHAHEESSQLSPSLLPAQMGSGNSQVLVRSTLPGFRYSSLDATAQQEPSMQSLSQQIQHRLLQVRRLMGGEEEGVGPAEQEQREEEHPERVREQMNQQVLQLLQQFITHSDSSSHSATALHGVQPGHPQEREE